MGLAEALICWTVMSSSGSRFVLKSETTHRSKMQNTATHPLFLFRIFRIYKRDPASVSVLPIITRTITQWPL
jgi:hypothetical protein